MLDLITSNLVIIITATILGCLAGMLWYSPRLFLTMWGNEQPHRNIEEEMAKDGTRLLVASIFDSLFYTLMAFVLFSAYHIAGVALLALSVTIGIYTNTLAKGGSTRLFLIDAGFLLCQLVIITAVILVLGGS